MVLTCYLHELPNHSAVLVDDPTGHNREPWITIDTADAPRSYVVKTSSGGIIRRNRHQLITNPSSSPPKKTVRFADPPADCIEPPANHDTPPIFKRSPIRTTKTFYHFWNTKQVSLLHLAAHHGWMDIVIELITKYKCDADCKDSRGRTPLHHAAIDNLHLEVVRYFINEQHCDPMTRDNDGETTLHLACIYGHFDITKYLISEAHLNPSYENQNGDTPPYHFTLLVTIATPTLYNTCYLMTK